MKVVSLNVNGLRSAFKKGLFDWLKVLSPDFICFQELKAQSDQLKAINLQGYFHYYSCAQKKGYSGVGILSKHEPKSVHYHFGHQLMDDEGRFLKLEFENFSIVSIYIPSGSYSSERQTMKMDLMNHEIRPWFDQVQGQPMIVCGDFNIAHAKLDIKNWKANQKNSGFLPEERSWMSDLFESGYVDTFRALYPEKEQYTWWSNRGMARQNNVGWRIDYQIVSKALKESFDQADVYQKNRFSDHAPLIVRYDILS